MTRSGSLALITALMVGLGASQALAARAQSTSGSTPTEHVSLRAQAVNVPPGVAGQNGWTSPYCLQPNMSVETRQGVMWERKPGCS
jgi:hypothetical protein